MTTIHESSAYNTAHFNALGYLQCYRSSISGFYKDILDDVHDLFQGIELAEGSRQLDLGSGASIHMSLSSTRKCCDITMAEFAKQNRDLLNRWLNNQLPEFDWQTSFEYIAAKEGSSAKDIEKRVREAIKEIVRFDVNGEWPTCPVDGSKYDVITSCLTISSGCTSVESYKDTIARTAPYLRNDGYIILVGTVNETKYAVGEEVFKVLPLQKEEIEDALLKAGYQEVTWRLHMDIEYGYFCDSKGHYAVRARKGLKP